MNITTRRKNGKIKPPQVDENIVIIIIVPMRKESENLPRCKNVIKHDYKADELARRQSELLSQFSFNNSGSDSDDDTDFFLGHTNYKTK